MVLAAGTVIATGGVLLSLTHTQTVRPPSEGDPPVASFTFSPADPQVAQIIAFDASGSSDPDGSLVLYDWEFGDGTTETGVVVEHAFSSKGTYQINLTVTDTDDLTDTAAKQVEVVEPPPSGISPLVVLVGVSISVLLLIVAVLAVYFLRVRRRSIEPEEDRFGRPPPPPS